MRNLKINNINMGSIPTSWKELTPEQLKKLCKLSFYTSSHTTLKVMLFCAISGMTLLKKEARTIKGEKHYWFTSNKTGSLLLALHQILAITKCFSFAFNETKNKVYLESGLVNNAFPTLRNTWFKKLYGPDSALFNITYAEFVRAEVLYHQLGSGKTNDEEYFNRLMAVLYRPANPKAHPDDPKFNGDMRIPFNDHLLKRYARHTSRLSPWQKTYIRLFYDGCRAYIIEKHPTAFEPGDSEDTTPKTPLQSFMALGDALTDHDPTKAEDLRKTLLWDILPTMEAMAIERKKQNNN